MITDFDDLCLWTYVIVDDIVKKLAPLLRRPGPSPDCSDSEPRFGDQHCLVSRRGWQGLYRR